MRKFMFFFLTTSAVILLVETIQLLTRVGSYDIDDYILNILGASLTFALLSSSPGKKLKQKIMHPISETEQNKDKK
jgi:glycopeptide antibiotics resistance protein